MKEMRLNLSESDVNERNYREQNSNKNRRKCKEKR
jgi:hypothetical protein